jgi:type IV pilus assembly protein PilE
MTQQKQSKGFTLIEMMIVVAIIGIIASFAYPAYMESVRRSNRADAKAELADVAQRLQRCYTVYNVYNHANCGVYAQVSNGARITSREGFYEIFLTVDNPTDFFLTATPVAGTIQASDTACTWFNINNTGARDASNNNGEECW